MEIDEFVQARIAEREATAINVTRFEVRDGIPGNYGIKDEVLAACEADRQLVELAQGLEYLREIGDPTAPRTPIGRDILEILAARDADHPDFHEEWRSAS
jgi:hypothetical protein